MKNHPTEAPDIAGEADRIAVRLNGDALELPVGTTVRGLVELLRLKGDRVAVELDRKIVRRDDWETAQIGAGAEVEIVHFVGGG